ncbi:hypothetical protein Acr_14g0002070 [Actinidia rufa]|uniref:Uncharacterized protein n=1 Tax=Actinidia rufa TaxID=165716 RepID=A0A7J0FPE1_9ERIC|nr:hypothetical protein Acr_14g0002070 [Actinidia rufa]
MALNRAQLLVHDDEALARFCANHRIPDDVLIERPSPNNATNWVEGEGNHIPVRTWFIHQGGLRFPLRKLLKKVMSYYRLTFMQVSVNFVRTVLAMDALVKREEHEFTAEDLLHVYCIVRPRRNAQTHMYEGFNARYWRRSECCVAAIRAVNNCGHTQKVADLLGSSLSIEVNDLIKGISAELRRFEEEAERESAGSSSSSSSDSSSSWDIDLRAAGDEEDGDGEVEDGEEVNQVDNQAQVPTIAPPCSTKNIVEHSFNKDGNLGYSSKAEEGSIAPKKKALGKKKVAGDDLAKQIPDLTLALPSPPKDYSGTTFAAVDLGKQVTTADTSKDHKTCLALKNVIMLPQDVVDLDAENLEEFGGRLVMMECSDLPAAYSPILLLGFDEEEYANMPPEGGGWQCCYGPEQQTCLRAKFGALVEFRANFFLIFAEYTCADPRGTEFRAIMELG